MKYPETTKIGSWFGAAALTGFILFVTTLLPLCSAFSTRTQPMASSPATRKALEPATVWQHVHEVLDEIRPSLAGKLGLSLRPVPNAPAPVDAPLYVALEIVPAAEEEDEEDTERAPSTQEAPFLSFYVGYSTWEGLCLFVDHLGGDPRHQELFLQVLAKIAVRHGSRRLTWKERPPQNPTSWHRSTPVGPPSILQELHIFQMDRPAMEAYVDCTPPTNEPVPPPSLDRSSVEAEIQSVLASPEFTNNDKFAIRLARANHAGDARTMERLVKGLAVYTKEPLEDIHCDAQDYLIDGSGKHPIYYCFLIEPLGDDPKGSTQTAKEGDDDGDTTNPAVGIAVVYFGHSHEGGRFLYLEDLYVDEAYRHQGAGSLALHVLTTLGLATGCRSFRWLALEWNQPALELYQTKMGATIQEGKKVTRYTDAKLIDFAASFSSTLEGM